MDFTLGEFIDSPFFDRGGLPLDQIIKLINDQSDIAEKGIEYVSSMHKPEKIYMKLEDIIRNINIYVGDLDQLVKSTINYVESQRKLATLILRRKIM